MDFFSAVEFLADKLNIEIRNDPEYKKKKTLAEENRQKSFTFHRNVSAVKDYLTKERGLTEETIDKFCLGANNGCVTIAFVDENDRYVGGAIRRFEGLPKYLNNKNNELFTKAEFLYGFRNAKEKLDNELYMVEGFFCAMSLWQAGKAAVAYNSSQPTKQQLMKIKKLSKSYPTMTVILVPDNDGKAYKLLGTVRKNVNKYAPGVPFVIQTLPEGIKDVNELYCNGIGIDEINEKDGCENNEKTMERISLDMFVLIQLLNNCSSIAAERVVAEKFTKSVNNELTLSDIGKYLMERWNVTGNVVSNFLKVSQLKSDVSDDFKDPETCLQETVELLTEPPVQFGLSTVDYSIRGGGRRRDVTFIGGYSSVGKTFFIVQVCMDMVVRQGKNVLFFSMEMSAGALYERIAACLLGVDSDEADSLILAGNTKIYKAIDKLKERLFVIDKNGLTINEIDNYIKTANAKKFENGVDVVMIDYLQYMKDCSKFEVVSETAKGMKPLAKENNVHVIVLSQLNRGSRIWEKPSMADLKGGGDLEASADIVFLLWKPGANPELTPDEAEIMKNTVMLGVGKARRGCKIDEIKLEMDRKISRFIVAKN